MVMCRIQQDGVPSGWKEPRAMETHTGDLSGRVMDRVRQMLCGLHGHDSLLQFQQDRMFLRCVSCGHETPGWDVSEPKPAAARTSAAPMLQPQLIRVRRVA
jgi:hypothetical protein